MEPQLAPTSVTRFAGPASQFQFLCRTRLARIASGFARRNIQIAERFPSRENVEMSLLMQSHLSGTRKRIEASRLVDQSPDHCLARHLTPQMRRHSGEDHDSHADSCRLHRRRRCACHQRSATAADGRAEDAGT
jgi:hypothetical protein